jgi:EmrB/QacA subfamily drug resistance transporter
MGPVNVMAAGAPGVGAVATGRDSSRWLVLVVVGIGQLMVVLDATVMNIALPSAQKALHFSNDERQWIVTAYSLAFGALVLLGGKLSDLFGRKWTLVAGLSGFALASAVGGTSNSFLMLAAARAVQGAFGALLAPSALSLLTTTFTEPAERNKAFGVYGAIAGGGASLGLLLGGALTQWLDWRAVMYINVVFAAVALAGALTLLRSQPAQSQPGLDVPGVLSVGVGLFGLVFGLSNAETTSWTDPLTIVMLVVGLAVLALFAWIESRVKNPLLPLRVLADRNRGASFLSIAIAAAGMFGVFLFLTYYLQQNLRYDPVLTGVAFLPMTVVLVATSITAQTLLRPRLGSRPLVTTGMGVAVVGLLLLTRLGVHATYATEILPSLVLVGMGIGLIFSSAINNATQGVQHGDAGVASATVNACQQIGGTLGTAVLSSIYAAAVSGDLATSHNAAAATVHGYATAFAASAGIYFIGAIIAASLFRSGAGTTQMASKRSVV